MVQWLKSKCWGIRKAGFSHRLWHCNSPWLASPPCASVYSTIKRGWLSLPVYIRRAPKHPQPHQCYRLFQPWHPGKNQSWFIQLNLCWHQQTGRDSPVKSGYFEHKAYTIHSPQISFSMQWEICIANADTPSACESEYQNEQSQRVLAPEKDHSRTSHESAASGTPTQSRLEGRCVHSCSFPV